MNAACYHAGLKPAERERVQSSWASGEIPVVVATVAFGMGIDKVTVMVLPASAMTRAVPPGPYPCFVSAQANVRGVVHWSMPKSIEGYVAAVGRVATAARVRLCQPRRG